jgi:hypothetical protein
MDLSVIVTALVTGATLALKDTAAQAVKDSYAGLRAMIVDRFRIGSAITLEKDPSDNDFQKSLEKEISLANGLLEDPEVAEAIARLYQAIDDSTTEAELVDIGIDIEKIKSKGNTVIKNIHGFNKGIVSKEITSGQDTVIQQVSGKPKA